MKDMKEKTMKQIFKLLVLLSALILFGIMYCAVLVDYKVIDRMWFDLTLVTGLLVSSLSLIVGLIADSE
jgi:flagellar biosynthesis protein FliQ